MVLDGVFILFYFFIFIHSLRFAFAIYLSFPELIWPRPLVRFARLADVFTSYAICACNCDFFVLIFHSGRPGSNGGLRTNDNRCRCHAERVLSKNPLKLLIKIQGGRKHATNTSCMYYIYVYIEEKSQAFSLKMYRIRINQYVIFIFFS